MKRTASIVLLFMIFLFNAMPVMVLAGDQTSLPSQPYEKVVAKNGTWYSDRISFEKGAELIVGYTRSYDIDQTLLNEAPLPMQFKIREAIVLKGIYLPYTQAVTDSLYIQLKDQNGNVYGPYVMQSVPVNRITEQSGLSDETINNIEQKNVNYIFNPDHDIVLPSGQYTMIANIPQWQVRTTDTGADGAFLIKGIDYSAYEKYKKELRQWEVENNPEKANAEVEAKALGHEEFSEKDLAEYQYEPGENPAVKKPAVFSLETDSLIDEIVINTFNDGKGAIPGTISILDENAQVIATYQSNGGMLDEVPNGIWMISPNIILPAGQYYIGMSDPSVVVYDKSGNPEFYVTASTPSLLRYDFTGTYSINLDTYKTSTLMGNVNEQNSSFSLRDFELTVLDKEGELELIGQYEGIPFSQACTIIEETENRVVASFDFGADLSKLPYKAKIGANAIVTLTKDENEKVRISIDGTATYQREATAEKGADSNTYSLKAEGMMKQKELPPFVMTALGKTGGVGNIPGPNNSVEGATGLLFPPLVGLVVHVLQEFLKPKEKDPSVKTGKYTKEWYKKNNPGLSEEQIAMLMLADAMGNTDNPDEGDVESVGDNEKTKSSDYVTPENNDQDNTIDEESYEKDSEEYDKKDSKDETEGLPQNDSPKEAEQSVEPRTNDPETLVLQTDHTGRTTEYIKDPETGEWVNPSTGGVLDKEVYEKVVKPNFEKDKAFIESEWEKNVKGETAFDSELKKAEQARKEAEAEEAYLQKLGRKYGTTDKEKLEEIIGKHQERDQESFKTWTKIGNFNEYGEMIATGVGTVSDTIVDGMANVTGPAGKTIRAAYKVTKGAAGTMAEKGVSVKSFVAGSIKGGADAATDYIDNVYIKSTVTIAGEMVGGAITEGVKGAKDGFVDGVFKVGVGAVTDKLGGSGYGNEVTTTTLKNGNVQIAVKSGEQWVNKTVSPAVAKKYISQKTNAQWFQSTVKGASGLLDEFGIKPGVAEPIKDSYK